MNSEEREEESLLLACEGDEDQVQSDQEEGGSVDLLSSETRE